ncbi:hypothetical protein BS50DRAFT_580388 [Corynespora cassiicola Philippines]|uniref:Uncharacterized protein n=1 Tax=Corynespora cassiicola Philippines TaxID=1448308 RepID=A0A2T2N0E1_CORCC|nr:hypothetical protein BS50DRAFT_580388 [Corynespora cassiicola Philippines]
MSAESRERESQKQPVFLGAASAHKHEPRALPGKSIRIGCDSRSRGRRVASLIRPASRANRAAVFVEHQCSVTCEVSQAGVHWWLTRETSDSCCACHPVLSPDRAHAQLYLVLKARKHECYPETNSQWAYAGADLRLALRVLRRDILPPLLRSTKCEVGDGGYCETQGSIRPIEIGMMTGDFDGGWQLYSLSTSCQEHSPFCRVSNGWRSPRRDGDDDSSES